MKPGDKVALKNALNHTVGTINRPVAPDIKGSWVVRISASTEIVVSESELELVQSV